MKEKKIFKNLHLLIVFARFNGLWIGYAIIQEKAGLKFRILRYRNYFNF